MKPSHTLITKPEKDYELLDSGAGQKLERFGTYVLARPDPQALWPKRLGAKAWAKADGSFTRSSEADRWALKGGMAKSWPIEFAGLRMRVEPTPFKHVGLFPEQKANWEWMADKVKAHRAKHGREPRVLNLFGYTGGATLACAKAGAAVAHVDGSKSALKWARENAALSGLSEKPVRWLLDDARDFVKRELRRGSTYDAVVMDPPAFGRGDKGQVWKIEDDLAPLFADCLALLSDQPLFFLVNGYAAGYSSIAYANLIEPLEGKRGGAVEHGELSVQEKGVPVHAGGDRLLPCGIFARWGAR